MNLWQWFAGLFRESIPGRSSPSGPPPSPPEAEIPAGNYSRVLLLEINKARSAAGLRGVALDPKLCTAALAHARNMASLNMLSHVGSDGSKMADRLIMVDYDAAWAGECVAAGQPTSDECVKAWLYDPPHRQIVLSRECIHVGAAGAASSSGMMYWCADFARPGWSS
jgi:uncharacterized protein YkwD